MDTVITSLSSVATVLIADLGGLVVGTGIPRMLTKRHPRRP